MVGLNPTHTYTKDGVFYYGRKVPKDLSKHYIKDRIVISLRTKSAHKASIASYYNARLTIYHLSKITQLDRATVRRKLLKLKEMNLVDRNDDGTWVSVSASNNPVAGQATAELMNNALTGVREFNQIVN